MIDEIARHIAGFPENQRMNRLREYLPLLILKRIDDSGGWKNIAFTGGTALRLVFKTERFSEDLDFSLVRKGGFDLARFAKDLGGHMGKLGLNSEVSGLKNSPAVTSFYLKFPGILYSLKLSDREEQKVSIKLEIDRNPPRGWGLDKYLSADPLVFMVTHLDIESLFAGKLHAFLFRGFDKGRDYYDVLFFLRKNTRPNMKMFRNAVLQTNPDIKLAGVQDAAKLVWEKVGKADFRAVRRDLSPFLLKPEEIELIRPEIILKAMDQAWGPFPSA